MCMYTWVAVDLLKSIVVFSTKMGWQEHFLIFLKSRNSCGSDFKVLTVQIIEAYPCMSFPACISHRLLSFLSRGEYYKRAVKF